MEFTQRLDHTQELYPTHTERTCPDQIGFIGICGEKYPVKRGPNKVGRDHTTCHIVLNLKAISKQHAVINIINDKEYMIMDLESANKTKINGKSLPPYIPHPVNNGDIIHFGNVFGVFRLLEEENDLPMTQALDSIPETPMVSRHVSKLNAHTTIPESPDVSDREESFIIASQKDRDNFKSSNNNFINKSAKTIAIQPVGSDKIDNIYWTSSKKSTSFNSHLNDSVSNKSVADKSYDVNIHTMDTQLPNQIQLNKTTDSIYNPNTQLPGGISPSIHSLDTQLPPPINEHLLRVCEVSGGNELQLHVFTGDKENDNNIFNAETQLLTVERDPTTAQFNDQTSPNNRTHKDEEIVRDELNESNEIILFDDFDSQTDENDYGSQSIVLPEISPLKIIESVSNTVQLEIVNKKKSSSGTVNVDIRLNSDSSTDCEDDIIFYDTPPHHSSTPRNYVGGLPTQMLNDNTLTTHSPDVVSFKIPFISQIQVKRKVIPKSSIKDKTTKSTLNADNCDDDITDLEEEFIEISEKKSNVASITENAEVDIGDMATQIIEENVINEDLVNATENNVKDVSMEELPTQILNANTPPKYSQEIVPFKVPLVSPKNIKIKDTPKSPEVHTIILDDVDNYYAATQDLLNDLCTQSETSLGIVNLSKDKDVPCSDENYGSRFPHLEDDYSKKYVSNLSSQQIRDVIGVDVKAAELKKIQSDSSDAEATPKKVRLKVMYTELPDSQEIKSSVSLNTRSLVTESSSDSESEVNAENQFTPILFKKNKVPTKDAKIDLTKKFDVKTLPTRVMTRIRKATAKLHNSVEDKNKITRNILKPKFLADQEDEIDKEIIGENISRLKNKSTKTKNTKVGNRNSNENKSKYDRPNIEFAKINTDSDKVEGEFKKIQTDIIDIVKSRRKQKETLKENQDTKSIEKKSNGHGHKSTEKKQQITNKKSTERKSVDGEQKNIEKENRYTKEMKEKRGSTEKKRSSSDKKLTPKSREVKQKTSEGCIDGVTKDTSNGHGHKSTENKQQITNKKSTERKGVDGEQKNIEKENRYTKEMKETRGSTEKKRSSSDKKLTPKSREVKQKTSEGGIDGVTKDNIRKTRRLRLKKHATEGNNKNSESINESEKLNRPKRSHKMPKNKSSLSPEKQVRRSKRQKNEIIEKSIQKVAIKTNHEESVEYNLSFESGIDSAKNLKRSASSDISVSNPKKRKQTALSSTVNSSISMRLTPARLGRIHHVLFTAFSNDMVRLKLEQLGALIVTDLMKCTVLVTMQLKRTFKLLCAVGLGRPIVGPQWVQACADNNTIVDPWLYIIKDETFEKRFHFDLRKTLLGKRNFLKGFNISSTPNINPNPDEMKLIVECSGGSWKEEGKNWLCLSCMADKRLWPALQERGATVVHVEFVLGGVLRQQALITNNKLC